MLYQTDIGLHFQHFTLKMFFMLKMKGNQVKNSFAQLKGLK